MKTIEMGFSRFGLTSRMFLNSKLHLVRINSIIKNKRVLRESYE